LTLFNFRLTPIESVAPWGHDDDLRLSWFGLTDGCYWLQVGENELFRATPQYLVSQSIKSTCSSYADYYVVRLWEDLLDILPKILSPVPHDLAEKLTSPNLQVWQERAYGWIEAREDVESENIYEQAIEFFQNIYLHTGYLKHGPTIWFWSDGTRMHIEWNNREEQEQGILVWEAQVGSWSLPIEEFLEAIRAFDREFMQAMQTRVEQIAAGWTRPGIRIDKDYLALEHADRSTWLNKALDTGFQKQSEDWSKILEAISLIESEK
jgi:hypothetical protein